LPEEKTLITHIEDGFDMLGWTFRKFKGKLIVKLSKSQSRGRCAFPLDQGEVHSGPPGREHFKNIYSRGKEKIYLGPLNR